MYLTGPIAPLFPLAFDLTAWLRRNMVAKENNGSIVWRLEESFTVVARVVRLIY